jgi:hypothetical protein
MDGSPYGFVYGWSAYWVEDYCSTVQILLGHVVQHSATTLGLLHKNIDVLCMDSTQIGSDVLSSQLEDGSLLNLLFAFG